MDGSAPSPWQREIVPPVFTKTCFLPVVLLDRFSLCRSDGLTGHTGQAGFCCDGNSCLMNLLHNYFTITQRAGTFVLNNEWKLSFLDFASIIVLFPS